MKHMDRHARDSRVLLDGPVSSCLGRGAYGQSRSRQLHARGEAAGSAVASQQEDRRFDPRGSLAVSPYKHVIKTLDFAIFSVFRVFFLLATLRWFIKHNSFACIQL